MPFGRKRKKSVPQETQSALYDPNGSYTGYVADNPYETPTQDADDL